jgi:formamidopyrimidine-DNA glycosylase
MTGHLRLFAGDTPALPYDHFEFTLKNGRCLRLSDPRKFGTVVWCPGDPLQHPLLAGLGPEPLDGAFTGSYLHAITRKRRVAIKVLLMNNHVVVGVGNIYANEACFRMGLDPARAAQELSRKQCDQLVAIVQEVLREAISLGGTTLRDYVDSHGEPGYFRLKLAVYGQQGNPCPTCGVPIAKKTLGGRSTYWCPRCQP